jgi:hypothetical protein
MPYGRNDILVNNGPEVQLPQVDMLKLLRMSSRRSDNLLPQGALAPDYLKPRLLAHCGMDVAACTSPTPRMGKPVTAWCMPRSIGSQPLLWQWHYRVIILFCFQELTTEFTGRIVHSMNVGID